MRSIRSAVLVFACWSLAPVYAQSRAPTDFSGVWSMVQHDRLGAPFFIPVEPELTPAGKTATERSA
jgi:hypothetical protein